MKLYSVYDVKADRFAPPFVAVKDEYARRTLVMTYRALGDDSPLVVYPSDFTLFAIGEFDEDTGAVKPLACMENLGTMLQIANKYEEWRDVKPAEKDAENE